MTNDRESQLIWETYISPIKIKYSKFGQRSNKEGGRWVGSSMGGSVSATITGYTQPVKVVRLTAGASQKVGDVVHMTLTNDVDGNPLEMGNKLIWELGDEIEHIMVFLDQPGWDQMLHQFNVPKQYKL